MLLIWAVMLKSFFQNDFIEAGCDEAGRGCLAGPVYAATVILPDDYFHPFLNDSKQLSAKRREQLRVEIEREAVAWSVSRAEPAEIDRLNILKASFLAIHRSIDTISLKPEFIIIDGNRFIPYKNIAYKCIVKGDATYYSIAAASVLAKTYRDEFMLKIHMEYPEYQWSKNKGYPTLTHRNAIARHGISPYHRRSFRLFDRQMELNPGFTSG